MHKGMAIISIKDRIETLEGDIKNVERSYDYLKDKDTPYAKEHIVLLLCYREVLNVYKGHYNKIVLNSK